MGGTAEAGTPVRLSPLKVVRPRLAKSIYRRPPLLSLLLKLLAGGCRENQLGRLQDGEQKLIASRG
jgi:hypothetical protein